jgi:hypothetical protein
MSLLALCSCYQDGATALMTAAYTGHDACLRMLLDAGADVNAINNVRHLWGVLLTLSP